MADLERQNYLKSAPSFLASLIKVHESNVVGVDVENRGRAMVDVEFDEIFNVVACLMIAEHEGVEAKSIGSISRNSNKIFNNCFRHVGILNFRT